jgi:diguanylate cyclase (GGDEF)-like protein
MKKIILEKVIFKNYLKTSLASILIIEVTLIMLYFYMNNEMAQKSKAFILDELTNTTNNMVLQQSKLLERKLFEIERLAYLLKKQIVSNANNFTGFLEHSVQNDDTIVGASVLFDNKKYTYPDLENLNKEIKDSNLSLEVTPLVDENNNLNWYIQNPSVDVLILKAVTAIYDKDELRGTLRFDVNLNGFVQNILKMQLPFKGKTYLLNNQGNVLAKCHFVCEQNQLNEIFSVIKKGTENQKVIIEGIPYYVYSKKLTSHDWYVVSFVPQSSVLKNLSQLEKDYTHLGYMIIMLIVLFYFLFFIFLIKKAKGFVKIINTPLKHIVKMTKDLGTKKNVQLLKGNNIQEFDELCHNFNTLSVKLHERTSKLIDSERKRIISEELANTDPLTKVYNRRFLADFAKQYIEIVKREKKSFCILLMDIDAFKHINDTYGHKVGDNVIISLVQMLQSTIRKNDVIVRLGGDEFLVVLPNTASKNAKKVASKIIDALNLNNLKKNKYAFTVSIGIAQFSAKEDKTIEDMLFRADTALYKAKSQGKNCFKF